MTISISPKIVNSSQFTTTHIKILRIINRFNHINGDCDSSIHCDVFDREIDGNYWKEMTELSDCDAITYTGFSVDKHQTRRYTINPYGIQILKDYNNRKLNDLQYNKTVIRKLQKTKSMRRSRYTPSNDIACNEIKETIQKITLPKDNWTEWVESQDLSDAGKEHAKTLIVNILEESTKLKRNKSDGRISNPATMLPVCLRNDIQINGRCYYRSIDIRSCHWSLLSLLLPSLSSILTENVDIGVSLREEVVRWNELFLSRTTNPRVIISKQSGIPENRLKEVMNSFLNSKGFKKVNNKWVIINKKSNESKLNEWFKLNFPTIHHVWINSDIKSTGNNISKQFETKLMLDSRIFEKRKECNLELLYSYDGYEVYCNDQDQKNLDKFLDFIEQLSEEILGIKLVFVSKDTRQTVEMLKESHRSTNKRLENLLNTLEPLIKRERKLYRKYKFAQKNSHTFSEKEYLVSYLELREKINGMLIKHSELIQS